MNAYMKVLEEDLKRSEWVNIVKRKLIECLPDDLFVRNLGISWKSDRHTNIADIRVEGDPAELMKKLEPMSISKYSGDAYGAIYPTITRELQYEDPVKSIAWIENARLIDIGDWYLDVWWHGRITNELIWYTDIGGYMVKVKHDLVKPIFEWYDEPGKDSKGHLLNHVIQSRCEIPEYKTWITIKEDWAKVEKPIQTSVYWLDGAERYIQQTKTETK
jgi:hypothetical protein